ncbi:MAG: NAD(+) kinase [Pseudomonadota bacterium]
MTASFTKIGLIGRARHENSAETLQRLLALLQERQSTVFIEPRLAKICPDCHATEAGREEIGERCDLAIVVGGDGSMLSAARTMAKYGTPLLGVNRGRLGFLTDVYPDEIEERVRQVLSGNFEREERFLLDVVVVRDGEVIGQADALNDVVVNSGTSAQMIEFDLFVDDTFVYRQRADGMIISTPTGSTAYSLSGGGPIMHPSLDALVLVPMFPHALSSRPIVIDGNSRVRVMVPEVNGVHPPVTCDGQVNMSARPGDAVEVFKKPDRMTLIHPPGHDFYASCRGKLGWGNPLVK